MYYPLKLSILSQLRVLLSIHKLLAMMLPQKIGNGHTSDEDEENTSRGASFYLDEATDVSYSEYGMEVDVETPTLLIVDPVNGSDDPDKGGKQQNTSRRSMTDFDPVRTLGKASERERSGLFQRNNNCDKAISFPSDQITRVHTIRSKPYKIELLRQHVVQNSPGLGRRTAILICLKEMGIKTYVIDGSNIRTSHELLSNVKHVVKLVALENCNTKAKSSQKSENQAECKPNQRCLLYQDEYGRLFNITLSNHAVGPVATYQEYLESFSGLQAMIALTVLCRSFPCMMSGTWTGKQYLQILENAFLFDRNSKPYHNLFCFDELQ
jgi:hypothetical protein